MEKTDSRKFIQIKVKVNDEYSEFLEQVKKLKIITMAEFVRQAIEYYLPAFKEKYQFEVRARYQKILDSGERWDKPDHIPTREIEQKHINED